MNKELNSEICKETITNSFDNSVAMIFFFTNCEMLHYFNYKICLRFLRPMGPPSTLYIQVSTIIISTFYIYIYFYYCNVLILGSSCSSDPNFHYHGRHYIYLLVAGIPRIYSRLVLVDLKDVFCHLYCQRLSEISYPRWITITSTTTNDTNNTNNNTF